MSAILHQTRSSVEEAGAWRIRIEADERVADSSEFLAWFAEPANRDAYARACATWDAFEDHLAAPQLIAVRRDALERARQASMFRFVPTRRRIAAAAAGLLLAVGAGIGVWHTLAAPSEYATGLGERRVVTLSDGSRLSLDSDTAVRVHYTKAVRQLVLERGRARFDVAHNIARPFTVTAGDETVVAVGTSFDVERLGQKVLVTLIEGRVVVKTASTAQDTPAEVLRKPVALAAGQELVANADTKPSIMPASLPVATAWETGRLVLNNETLGEAVERINRYTDKPLLVDPSVANVRISGVFNAGDVASFVDAVTSYFPVQASVNDSNQTVLQKRS